MTKGSGLIVEHCHLDKSFVFDFSRISSQSYFCIFWWKDIALGDCSFEAGTVININQIRKKIWEVISAGINNYKPTHLTAKILEASFLSADKMWFYEEMNSLLAEITGAPEIESADVSVVICTRDRSEELVQCIGSILSQKVKAKEIVIIDSAPSNDNTEKAIANYNKENIIYHRESMSGLNVARNSGAKIASGQIVLYTDDVVKVHPLWIYHTWKEFQNKNYAALTGLVISSTAAIESKASSKTSSSRDYEDSVFDSTWLEGNKEYPESLQVNSGANMAFRKSVLKMVNYFDEVMDQSTVKGMGDSEIWFRLLCFGHKIKYSPRVIVIHEHGREYTNPNNGTFHLDYNNSQQVSATKNGKHFRYMKYCNSRRIYQLFNKEIVSPHYVGFKALINEISEMLLMQVANRRLKRHLQL